MSTVDEKSCNMCKRLGLRPFTKHNILFYYAPLHSLVTYGALSVNVMNPSLVARLFPKRDVTNFLLVHTFIGTTLYIYNRPHLQTLDTKKRAIYSLFGSSLFGLGSVLFWAILRNAIPDNNALCTSAGVVTGFLIARVGYEYLEHIDGQIVKAN